MRAKSLRTILVAIARPGERSQPALDRAVALAAASGARLVMFHSAFDPALSGRPFFDSPKLAHSRGEVLARGIAQLEKRAATIRESGVATEVIGVWEDPPYEAIIRAVIRVAADLVVAGPHADGSARRRVVLRQTDWQLMRLCPRPLLLVRTRSAPARGVVLASLDPMHMNDKPAALDRELAAWAGTIAAASGSDLHAAHCVTPGEALMGKSVPGARTRALHAVQKALRSAGVVAKRIHIAYGIADREIVALATKTGADVLAMGTISRRGLDRMIFGDTAERIIDAVSCDLLIVKPAGFRPRMRRNVHSEPVTIPDERPAGRRSRSS